jgi:hypothetical protein
MQSFKIQAAGLKSLKNKFLKRMASTLLIVMCICVGMTFANLGYQESAGIYQFAFIPFMLLVGGFSFYRGLQKQKALLESYELTISDNLIVREQLNTQDIAISIKDVQEIVKYKNGSIYIKGKDNQNPIIVPAQINNYEQLEITLQQIHPISIKAEGAFKQKIQVLLSFAAVGSMICVFVVNNKIVVGIAGTAFAILSIWGLVMIQRSKNVDRKTKNMMWISLLAILSTIGTAIMKLVTDMP